MLYIYPVYWASCCALDTNEKKIISPKKASFSKRKVAKNKREIDLYSPEYLAKKHGIKIKDSEPKFARKIVSKDKVSLGFYSSLLVFLVLVGIGMFYGMKGKKVIRGKK